MRAATSAAGETARPWSRAGNGAGDDEDPRAQPHEKTAEAGNPAEPEGSATPWVAVLIGETNIFNRYSCGSKRECGILESTPEAGEEETMENATTAGPRYITPSHAEVLSKEFWGQGRGRTRQAIMKQLKRIKHVQSMAPPRGQKNTLLDYDSFIEFDRAKPPWRPNGTGT